MASSEVLYVSTNQGAGVDRCSNIYGFSRSSKSTWAILSCATIALSERHVLYSMKVVA